MCDVERRHNAPGYCVFMDGTAWCAVRKGFINLQESESGWGETPTTALDDLINTETRIEDQRCLGMRKWLCGNCGCTFHRGKVVPNATARCPRCTAGNQFTRELIADGV